jgi:glycosyltransferase involved in cell wall biosynthesis
MKEKIGVGIVTCDRPEYLKNLLNSIDACESEIDEIVVVDDGKKQTAHTVFDGTIIGTTGRTGVAKAKNLAIENLLGKDCDYIFIIEDDMIVIDKSVFQQYIKAHKISGIHHFNYGPGSPFNRKQKIKNFDLHNRHLLDQHTEPNPKLTINYKDCTIALYEHTVAMFSFFTKEVLQDVGLIDERYYNAWEHVDHTYEIIKKGYHPPFWWFADLANSHELLTEAPGAIDNSSIANKTDEWQKNVQSGMEIYKEKHGHYPNQPPYVEKDEVVNMLKTLKSNQFVYSDNIVDKRIKKSQYIPEFEILLEEFIKIKPSNILEIGSYFGWSLHHWIKLSNSGSTVISIDLPISRFCGEDDPRCKQQEEAINTEWKQWANSNKSKLYLIPEYSQTEYAKQRTTEILNGKLLDFLFIDGNHMYAYVKKDFEMYLPLVRKGGIIAFHDIGLKEEGGVHKLWDEIKNDYKHLELRLHPNQEKGIGIIYV